MFSIFVHPIIAHPDYSIITINPDNGVLRIRDSLTAVTKDVSIAYNADPRTGLINQLDLPQNREYVAQPWCCGGSSYHCASSAEDGLGVLNLVGIGVMLLLSRTQSPRWRQERLARGT